MRILFAAMMASVSAFSLARAFTRSGGQLAHALFRRPMLQQRQCPSSLASRGGGGACSSSGSESNVARRMSTVDTTTTAVKNNPLLQQEDLPKFASIQPSDLTPAVEELLAKMDSDFSSLEEELRSVKEGGDVDFDAVLPEIERIQYGLGFTWGVAGHLNGVKNGPELRDAYEANQPKIVQAMSRFQQSRPVYDALKALESQWEKQQQQEQAEDDFVASQRHRAVDNSLRSMTLGGVGFEGEEKERFNQMKIRLAELSTKFGNNVLDETKAFSITINDATKMEGVPDSAKAMWANAHAMFLLSEQQKKEGEEQTTAEAAPPAAPEPMDPEKGPWRITLDGPSYMAAMYHLRDRSLREKLYMASIRRASEASEDQTKNNIPLIYEILKLKTEMAQMLGFTNYAEQSLASKMAPSVKSVEELTDLIAAKALPAAERELEEITALARAEGGELYGESNLPKLAPWDISFWSERLKESKFELTEEETRPYFALPAVLDGLFALVNRLFNVEIRPADGDAEVWHPDVQFFKMFDTETGKHVASFYLDPYTRPEDKRGGAWMDVCIGKSEAVNRDVPVAYLTCNGSPPVGDQPSLMTFREVETLFHETGHGLQHMLTTATLGDVAGINGVEWDAVELPSQFMENWCYDRPTIYGFAKHWETGEPMPEEMFDKLKQQKTYGAGMMACRQLYFGQLDIELHSKYDASKGEESGGETVFDVQRKIASKYTPYNMPLPEDRFLCTFGHIFAGGYSAGYYSYKWAEVMSADAFAAFEEAGLDDEAEVGRVGKLFRDTVLSLGGGVSPMDVFKRFRGREPSPEALLRHNGLA